MWPSRDSFCRPLWGLELHQWIWIVHIWLATGRSIVVSQLGCEHVDAASVIMAKCMRLAGPSETIAGHWAPPMDCAVSRPGFSSAPGSSDILWPISFKVSKVFCARPVLFSSGEGNGRRGRRFLRRYSLRTLYYELLTAFHHFLERKVRDSMTARSVAAERRHWSFGKVQA